MFLKKVVCQQLFVHFSSGLSYTLLREKKLTKGKKGTGMNQRTQGKIEFYAKLLQKLQIISEKEKQEILKISVQKKAF